MPISNTNALKWLNRFTDYEKTTSYSYNAAYFDLKRMEYLLELLGSPQKSLQCIHITGTKGKGSTAYFAASILSDAGLKTGLYTSPHIISMNERVKINGKDISGKEIAKLVPDLRKAVGKLAKTRFGLPTYFEVYTALAFLHFKRSNCGAVVLEVGMGGRLDATNVITPLVSVITPISLDHVKELGGTLAKIAGEKAGIIKEFVPCVIGRQETEALRVLLTKAGKTSSRIVLFGRDISVGSLKTSAAGSVFNLSAPAGFYKGLSIKMIGAHQAENAALAVCAAESALASLGLGERTAGAVKAGLKNVRLPGRLDYYPGQPALLLDAAHNEASALVLRKAIRDFFPGRTLILIIGMSVNKDIDSVRKILFPIADKVIAVKSANYRSALPEQVLGNQEGSVFQTVKEGIQEAKRLAGKNSLIVVTGSFYVLSDVYLSVGLNRH